MQDLGRDLGPGGTWSEDGGSVVLVGFSWDGGVGFLPEEGLVTQYRRWFKGKISSHQLWELLIGL